jgi:hypothetical protein
VAITLGKDCVISVGGAILSARSVSLSYSARTIDVEEYASRSAAVYPVGYEATVSVEFNDPTDLGSVYSFLTNGTEITVTGGAGAWSFPAVITGVTETDPLDGVATFTVEARLTRLGLRAQS